MPTNGQFAVGELVTASDANTLFTRGYRNRIINGAFVINQRGYTSTTNLASGSYGFDRWKSGYTNTALTFTAGSQSTTVTISASGVLQQIIERENMPANTYTLSWTGTATGRVYNSGATPPAYAAGPITVSLDGSANVVVEFTASGSTKTLGLVQLEAGTVYSPFEYRFRNDELLLCQRYFIRFPGQTGTNYNQIGSAGIVANTTTVNRMALTLPVPMRKDIATADLTYAAGALTVYDGTGLPALTSHTIYSTSPTTLSMDVGATGGGLSAGRPGVLLTTPSTPSGLSINAEL